MFERKWVSRWVIAANSSAILLLGLATSLGYQQDRQLAQLRSLSHVPPAPNHQLRTYLLLALLAALLVSGTALELMRAKWAWVINAGLYWFIFLLSLWQSIAALSGTHPDEVAIGVILIVVPSGIAALVSTTLYALPIKTSIV